MDCWTRLNECVDASAGAAPCPFQSASLAGKNWAGVQIRLQVQFWAPTRTHMHIHKATRNYKNGTRQNEYNESHNDTTNELLPIRNQFVIALWNEKKQNNFFFSTFKKFRFSKFFFGQSHNGTSSDVDGWRQLGFVFHAATFLLAWEVLPGLRNGVVPLVAVETPPTTSSALNDWSAFSCFHRGFLFTFLCVFPPSTFSFFFFNSYLLERGGLLKVYKSTCSAFRWRRIPAVCDTPTSSSPIQQLIRKKNGRKRKLKI